MGLTFKYSGSLRKAESLPDLVEEIQDIAKVYGWECRTFNTRFPDDKFENHLSFDNFYGIEFTPPKCDTVSITFVSNGEIASRDGIINFADLYGGIDKLLKTKYKKLISYLLSNWAKTQFAGAATHKLLMQLFKYLDKKYFENFKLEDDSGYWETEDEDSMQKQFGKYDTETGNFELAIETFPIQKNENMSSYFERLLHHINNLKKD
jgi:hypothetical protein